MEELLHPVVRKALEEADSIAESMAELCQELRDRLAKEARPYRRFADSSDALFQLKEINFQVEKATGYLSDLRPALEQLHAKLLALETEHGRLTTLFGISQTLNSTLHLEDLLNVVMDRLIDILRAERGFLMLIDNKTKQLDFKVARNMSSETLAESSFHVSRSIIDKVVAESTPVLSTNAQADPRFSTQASVIGFSLRSILCVPLIAKNRLIGVVYVDNRIKAGLFGQNDLDLLVAFANQAAIAIENARLFESVVNTMNEVAKMKVEMENIFASITSGVVTIGSNGEVTAFNGAAEKIFELATESVLGRPYREVFVSLEQTPVPGLVEEVLNSNVVYVGQEVRCDLGSRREVILTVSLSALKTADNQTVGVAIVIEDVTETRRLLAEKKVVRDTFERVVAKAVVDRLLSSPPKLGGERQTVTVLFADIRGYTSLAESISPEELVIILNCYLAFTTSAVLKYEGTVDKILGDGIMALFNAPLSQPDHAERAAKAALEIVRLVDEYHCQPGVEAQKLSFGIGINTGEAVVGNIGAAEFMNYTVIGDAVNVARRLQENARPGQILVSESTCDLIKSVAKVEPLELMHVRGRSSPVFVYQLLDLAT
ncbi:MAG: adenylate/guanylate cyclase domain-containing protein [Dehalococcoidia bacterium]|nr:adenylate/guanylate cyclase domain-containing protein [Dehalococcoidia bacterium]